MQDLHAALAAGQGAPEEFGHRLADEGLCVLALDELAISDVQDAVAEGCAALSPCAQM